MRNNYLDYSKNIQTKRFNAYTRGSVHCKNCGHTMFIANKDRKICTHCGYWVYKDDKTEFKYKMQKIIDKR